MPDHLAAVHRFPAWFALPLLVSLPLAALAQYKVVGPDGKVTYTDRPAIQSPGKVSTVATDEAAPAATGTSNAILPLDLRQAAQRYPVTLYAQPSCDGCEAGRQYLRQRGIPYAEKLVGNDDGAALQRVTGSREIPALTIGSQVLKGFSADNWGSYLDAAGYPKASRLPANYVAPAPSPLVAARPAPSPTARAPVPNEPVAPPPAPGGIRF